VLGWLVLVQPCDVLMSAAGPDAVPWRCLRGQRHCVQCELPERDMLGFVVRGNPEPLSMPTRKRAAMPDGQYGPLRVIAVAVQRDLPGADAVPVLERTVRDVECILLVPAADTVRLWEAVRCESDAVPM